MNFNTLASLPIIDSHVHFIHPEYLEGFLGLLDEAGCARANLVCMPNPDASTHNPAALYFKERYPERVLISAALEYAPILANPSQAPGLLADQIRTLKRRGFDGLKLIEGKPQVCKLLPHPLDGPLYVEMWAALEEEQLPVVFHVADPDEFWDAEACPDWARQSGWDYSDGSFPTKEALYTEVENILKRHPTLKITFAHFFFLSTQLARASRFLEEHPTVCFDLAPHTGMYQDFSLAPEPARNFFLQYQDRILYGTDLDTRPLLRGEEGYDFMRSILWLVRSALETDGFFGNEGESRYHGLGLPEDVLKKIYYLNFERIYGLNP